MWWIKAYAKRHRLGIILYAIFVLVFALVMFLYHLPLEPVGYAAGLCTVLVILVFLADGVRSRRKMEQLRWQAEAIKNGVEHLYGDNGIFKYRKIKTEKNGRLTH